MKQRTIWLICLLAISYISAEDAVKEAPGDFVVLQELSGHFDFDMRYASNNNFLKEKVYPCGKCLLRREVAEALIAANQDFVDSGFCIKLFDCYRPEDVQKKMWAIYPNATYVANPYKKGSVHNRGGAVDLTLVDMDGNNLDMGTDFDYFGREAYHEYPPTKVSDKNRQFLKKILEKHGFNAIRSEWWHYGFGGSMKYQISNFPITCE